MEAMKDGVEISPIPKDAGEIPELSASDFLLHHINKHLPALANKPWVVSDI